MADARRLAPFHGCGFVLWRSFLLVSFDHLEGEEWRKPCPAGIGGVLRNEKGEVLYMFSKHGRVKDSNEVEVLVILETFRIYSWKEILPMLFLKMNSSQGSPWKFHFFVQWDKFLSSQNLSMWVGQHWPSKGKGRKEHSSKCSYHVI